VSALFGQAFEREGWTLSRMTMDFVRRVPMDPLRLVAGSPSQTRRARRQGLELWADDELVAKAEALLLPQLQIEDFPPQPTRTLFAPQDSDQAELDQRRSAAAVKRIGYPSFVSHGIAARRERINGSESAVKARWVKLLLPTIAGHEITPVQRACAAADFANGGFRTLSFDEWTFVNLDLTVQLVRDPADDWIAVVNNCLASNTGVGLGDAELHDKEGRIGSSTATLLIERR
jgi:hypothetical protein